MSVLDPTRIWFWLLYVLAGCGVTVLVLPRLLSQLAPNDRETLKTMPALRAAVWALCVVCWPVMAIRRLLQARRGN
jgi:hypothetical protein